MADNKDKSNNSSTVIAEATSEIKPDAITKPVQQPEVKVEPSLTAGLGDGATEATVMELLSIINESTEVVTAVIEQQTDNAIATIAQAQAEAEELIEMHFGEAMGKLEQTANNCVKRGNEQLRAKLQTARLTLDNLKAKASIPSGKNASSNGNGKG